MPNYYENIKRANDIKVRALNQNGEKFEMEASEILAVCIQHEIDHLNVFFLLIIFQNSNKNALKKKPTRR